MLIPEPVRYRNKGAQKPILGNEGEKEVEIIFTKRMRVEAIVWERGKRREKNKKKRRENEGMMGKEKEKEEKS